MSHSIVSGDGLVRSRWQAIVQPVMMKGTEFISHIPKLRDGGFEIDSEERKEYWIAVSNVEGLINNSSKVCHHSSDSGVAVLST